MTDFSVIICTYNPDPLIFSRVLRSIKALEIPENMTLECVIVDNNSTLPITDMDCVKDLVAECNWVRVITEPNQGLTFARIAGTKSTTAPIIVFFDDDNEPASNYLRCILHCIDTYPCVALWGPGKITVEYLEPVSEWFSEQFSASFFQQKNSQYTEYGCVIAKWQEFYPFGTGLVVKRENFEKYCQKVEAGELNAVGRKGRNLSSSEDLQIVWEAVKAGFAAGTSPKLQLKHLIPEKRSNLRYVKRLAYGCSVSYMPAFLESFPSEKEKVLKSIPSNWIILKNIARIIKLGIFRLRHNRASYKRASIELAEYIGDVLGLLLASDSVEKQWIYNLLKILDLDDV